MTIKEKLQLMREINKRNVAREKAFIEASKTPSDKPKSKKGRSRKKAKQ